MVMVLTEEQMTAGEVDEFGNLWLHEPIDIGTWTDEMGQDAAYEKLKYFCRGFYGTLDKTHPQPLIIALGYDHETLGQGFTKKGLSPSYHYRLGHAPCDELEAFLEEAFEEKPGLSSGPA